MNQILETNSKKTNLKKAKNNFKMFKIQLIFSTSILAILLFFCIYHIISLKSKENLSADPAVLWKIRTGKAAAVSG